MNWRSYDKLAENSRALLAELDRTRPPRLIIDLRGGGDYNHGRSFIEQLVAAEVCFSRKAHISAYSAARGNGGSFGMSRGSC